MKKISIYIIKNIFKNFFIIFCGLFVLFFIFDLLEDGRINVDTSAYNIFKMTIYRIPMLLEKTLHLIFLLSSLISFYTLSNNNEIVIIRSSGMSMFQILKVPAIFGFLFGIFVILVYSPFANKFNARSKKIVNTYFENRESEIIKFKNGLWFKQDNGKTIIKIEMADRNLLSFEKITMLFLDKNNAFLKRIDAESGVFDNGKWKLKNAYIYQENSEKTFINEIDINSTLVEDFIKKTIKNNYSSIDETDFIEISSTIKELKMSGFNTKKIEVKYYSLMVTPFIFAVMIMIGAYFGVVHNRGSGKALSILNGIIFGFGVFIVNNIITEFAIAEKITLLDGSVFLACAYFILCLIMLIRKDKIIT
jgi:lipopolysaccharide export system permease protein